MTTYQKYEPPGPDEVRTYFINRTLDAPIRVEIKGVPPCLWCGVPVTEPSADGPLVCPHCDMGVNKDGTRWTNADYMERREQFKRSVEEYAARAGS